MRISVLVKYVIGATFLSTLVACGGDDVAGSGTVEKPVTINGQKDFELTYNESSGTYTIDLLKDVVNPEQSSVFVREIKQIDNALIAGEEPPELAEGEVISDGPKLGEGEGQVPNRALVWTGNRLVIDTGYFSRNLADKEKADLDPAIHEYGKYSFSFVIDNGAEEQVERKIVLTVNGLRDDVIGVKFKEEQGFSIPMASTYQLQARAATKPYPNSPDGEEPIANNPKLTYSLPADSPITITQQGVITTPIVDQETPFIVVVQSDEGDFTETISGVISVLEEPNGIAINSEKDGPAIDFEVVTHGGTLDLFTTLLPAGVDWNNLVVWSTSDSSVVSIDQSGTITGVKYVEGEENSATITALAYRTGMPDVVTTINVKVVPDATNWFTLADPGFEKGPLNEHWVGGFGNEGTLMVTDTAAKDGDYGLSITNTPGTLRASTKEGDLIAKPFRKDKFYKLTFDAMSDATAWRGGQIYLISFVKDENGVNRQVTVAPHTTITGQTSNFWGVNRGNVWEVNTKYFDGAADDMQDLGNAEVIIQIWISGDDPVEFSIDNLRFEEVDRF